MEKKVKKNKKKEAEADEPTVLDSAEKETIKDDPLNSDINESEIDQSENNENAEKNIKEELELLKDEKLRLLAEMDNIRKRSDRERSDLIKYGSMNFARDVLSLDDNLSRALDSIAEEHISSEKITL